MRFGTSASRWRWWRPRRSPAGCWARMAGRPCSSWKAPCPSSGCPIWWFFISDHPREAKWISPAEREFLETTLEREAAELEPVETRSVLGAVREMGNSRDDRHEFPPQFPGLRLHDLFHGRFEAQTVQPAAIWISIRRALCRHRRHHGAQFLAFGQNPGTPRARRAGLYAERRQPDCERAVAATFLALLRVHVPGHPRTVCRPGAVLGDSHRNPAAQCDGSGHRTGQCHRQHRRIRRPVHRRLARRCGITAPPFPSTPSASAMLVAAALAFLLPKAARQIQSPRQCPKPESMPSRFLREIFRN